VNFLNTLNEAEWRALKLAINERSFAAGVRIPLGGGRTDDVLLILSGRVRVVFQEDQGERACLDRGPGQFVPGDAEARISEGPATVIALETVRALVGRPEDFARVIPGHPRALSDGGGLAGGVPAGGTITPAENGPAEIFPRTLTDVRISAALSSAGHIQAGTLRVVPRRPLLAGENCTVIVTDVVGFGGLDRSDEDRRIVRDAGLAMMRAALGSLWDECVLADRGDGLLVVVPPRVPTAKVLELVHRELPGRLRVHNHTYAESARMRLRLAAHVGPITEDSLGPAGEAIIRASRLLDASTLKGAMAASGASLGIIVSEFVYDTAIKHSWEWAEPAGYAMVEATVKESRILAWMRLIDPVIPPSRDHGLLARGGRGVLSRVGADAAAAIPPLVKQGRRYLDRGKEYVADRRTRPVSCRPPDQRISGPPG
jgi:CRP-like cAMP-binding protein